MIGKVWVLIRHARPALKRRPEFIEGSPAYNTAPDDEV